MTNALQIAAAHAARRYAETGAGKRIRLNSGLSLLDVAKAVGVPESTISRWERGLRVPHRSVTAARWAALLADLERPRRGKGN